MVKFGKYLVVMAAMLLSVACSSDDGPGTQTPVGPAGDSYMAGFDISLYGGDASESRATPVPGDYENGSLAENFVDIEGRDFRIYFFDGDDRFICQLGNIEIVPLGETRKRYYVNGTVPKDLIDDAGRTFKVVMLANWRGTYPQPEAGVTTVADLAESPAALYAFDFADGADQLVSAERPIPLFGASNLYPGVVFLPNIRTHIGTLHLLRAYAKVRVRAGIGSRPITSVSMTRVNTRGYRAPLGVTDQDEYVHGNWADDYYHTPSIPADPAQATDMGFVKGDDGEWTIYLPEYRNIADTDPKRPLDTRALIRVTFTGTDGRVITEYVDFKFYNTPPSFATGSEAGDHFDILRNTVYDYTLTKIDEFTDVNIEVDVQPYAEQWLLPDFGIMRDEEGDLRIDLEYDADGNVVRDENGEIRLPDNFRRFLAAYQKSLPPFTLLEGDYYAIHLGADGLLANAEIWVKDKDQDRVLSDLSPESADDQHCSTRRVIYNSGYIKTEGYKDQHGDLRLRHFPNHTSIVRDRLGYTIFKDRDNKERLMVESWEPGSDTFWVVGTNNITGETIYMKYVLGVYTEYFEPWPGN